MPSDHQPEAPENRPNRRQHRRQVVNIPARLILDRDATEGNTHATEVDIVDMSYTGLRIEADAERMRHIQPDIDSTQEHEKVSLRLTFNLPGTGGRESSVLVHARSTYAHPVSYERACLGLEFIDIEDGIIEFSEALKRE